MSDYNKVIDDQSRKEVNAAIGTDAGYTTIVAETGASSKRRREENRKQKQEDAKKKAEEENASKGVSFPAQLDKSLYANNQNRQPAEAARPPPERGGALRKQRVYRQQISPADLDVWPS